MKKRETAKKKTFLQNRNRYKFREYKFKKKFYIELREI